MIPDFIDFTRICPVRMDMARRFAASRADGVGFAELLRETDSGQIGLTVILNRRVRWTPRLIKSPLPQGVVVSDDYGNSTDPDCRWLPESA
jgi:hypothetical protein